LRGAPLFEGDLLKGELVPEKVPLWVVENTFSPHGGRMPQRGVTLPNDLKICKTCQKELYEVQDWHYCGEKYYCTEHIDEARKAQSAIWEQERLERQRDWAAQDRARGFVAIPRSEAEVPAGNLDEYLYQYWIGVNGERGPVMSTRSTCRACGTVVFGAMGRAIHKSESTRFYIGEYSCMKVIANVIREMVAYTNCLVCKNYTSKKHYGVPICSPNCHKVWRFAEKMQYPELDALIAPYWMSTTTTTETGGSTILESSSSQTPTVLLPGEEGEE
jgi:hypothetical protein